MQTSTLGSLGAVSRLTLGGGGIGQVWGPTSREEGIATLRLAVDEGIDLIDAAPGYKVCEALIGETFEGRLPTHVRVTTKHHLGRPPASEVYSRLRDSLEKSLRDMRLERVDVMFLHNQIYHDGFTYPDNRQASPDAATPFSLYHDAVVPAFERLVTDGLIGTWGITGIGVPDGIIAALETTPRPAVVQAIANLLDSPGALAGYDVPARPRDVIASARRNGVGVMGIRAVQAGSLTSGFDRPMSDGDADAVDFERSGPFRDLCRRWGLDAAIVAHRYALGIEGVDTLVLGVKNREELRQCLAAEAAGPLSADETEAIEALGLRGAGSA